MGLSIYLGTSWRNKLHSDILATLRADGHSVYDFKNPAPGDAGFSWRQIGDRFGKCADCGEVDPLKKPERCPRRYMKDPGLLPEEPGSVSHLWEGGWTAEHFAKDVLNHPAAERGFSFDMNALDAASACVLVQPCGRSAHLELGYAVGQGKLTVVYYPELDEPELMVRMCDYVVTSVSELRHVLSVDRPPPRWQRDVAENDAKVPHVNLKDTYPRGADLAKGEKGLCRPYRHRLCKECGGCWRHGACTCEQEARV